MTSLCYVSFSNSFLALIKRNSNMAGAHLDKDSLLAKFSELQIDFTNVDHPEVNMRVKNYTYGMRT